jgi:hypothetical protein
MPKLVYLVNDLLFVSKIRETAQQLGFEIERAATPAALQSSAASSVMVILDLRRPDAIATLDALRADAATSKIPAVGFVDHEREDILEAARSRDCTALAKGKFSTDLPRLLAAVR